MRLPKSYYEYKGLEPPDDSDITISNYNELDKAFIYPGFDDFKEEDSGDVADFLGQVVWGGLSGLSWGTSESKFAQKHLGVKYKSFESMNAAEKAGWVVGEGLSFFLPYGPFSLMGKMSLSGTKLLSKAGIANKYIRESTEGLAKGSTTLMKAIEKKGGKELAEKVGKDLSQELPQEMLTNKGISALNTLKADELVAKEAIGALEFQSDAIIRRIFKEHGLDMSEGISRTIAKNYVEKLKAGHYANDLSNIITASLGGKDPGDIAKYIGMATQDMLYMGFHAVATEKIRSTIQEREANYKDRLAMSAIMALGFPLIGKVFKAGGKDNIERGMKAYFERYKKINYNKIMKGENGEEAIGQLLKQNIIGVNKNIFNSSFVADKFWKVHGKKRDAGWILEAIENNKLTGQEMVKILNTMKLAQSKEFVKKWRTNYMSDFVESLPRIGASILFSNVTMMQSGYFDNIPTEELAAHLFMSAFMTKSRGAWGESATRGYISNNYGEMKKGLDYLNVDYERINSVIKMMDRETMLENGSIFYDNSPLATQVVEIFDNAKFNGTKEGKKKPFETNLEDSNMSKVNELLKIYNTLKYSQDPEFEPRHIDELDAFEVKQIKNTIDTMEIDGTPLKDLSFAELQVEFTKENKENIIQRFHALFNELGQRLNMPIVSPDGETKGKAMEISTHSESTLPNIVRYNEIIRQYGQHLNYEVVDNVDNLPLAEDYAKEQGLTLQQFDNQIGIIANEHLKKLSQKYDHHNIASNFEADNIFLKGLSSMANVESKNNLFRLVSNSTPRTPELQTLQTSLLSHLGTNGKIFSEMPTMKNIKDMDEAQSRDMHIIQEVHELLKVYGGREITKSKGEIDPATAKQLAESIREVTNGLPRSWKENLVTSAREAFQSRMLGEGSTASLIILNSLEESRVKGTGSVKTENGITKIVFPSKRSIISKYGDDTETAQEVIDAIAELKNHLNKNSYTESNELKTDENLMEYVYAAEEVKEGHLRGFVDDLSDTRKILSEDSYLERQVTELGKSANAINTSFKDGAKIDESQISNFIDIAKLLIDHDSTTPKGKKLLEESLKRVKKYKDPDPGYDIATGETNQPILTIDQFVNETLQAEQFNKKRLIQYANKISNAFKADSNLTMAEARVLVEELQGQLKDLTENTLADTVPLSEMLDYVNKNGRWGDVSRIIGKLIQQEQLKDTGNLSIEEPNSEIVDKLDYLNESEINHNRPMQATEIILKHGLGTIDDPNILDLKLAIEIDKGLDDASPISLHEVFDKNIYSKLRKKYSDDIVSYDKAVNDFKIKEAPILIKNIYGSKNVKVMTLDGDLLLKNEAPIRKSLTTEALGDKLEVIYLKGKGNTGYRNEEIDVSFMGGEVDGIQKVIDEKRIVNENEYKKIIDDNSEGKLNDDNIASIIDNDKYVYVRLSNKGRIIIKKDNANLAEIKRMFDAEYEPLLNRYKNEDKSLQSKLEKAFGHMYKSEAGLDLNNNILRSMVNFVFLRRTIAPKFDGWLKIYNDDTQRGEYEVNMFKRIGIADGGTSTIMAPQRFKYLSEHHPDPQVREHAKKLLDDNNYTLDILNDESDFFSNKQMVMAEHERKSRDLSTHPLEKLILEDSIEKIIGDEYPSLESFALDGGIFLSEAQAKVFWAAEGGQGEWNGAKPVIMSNDLLGKGFMIYHPDLAKHIKGDMLVGKTVAKTLTDRVTPYEIQTSRIVNGIQRNNMKGDWGSELSSLNEQNQLKIPLKDIGVSFTSNDSEGVNLSTSMFEFQPGLHVKEAERIMQIDTIIEKMKDVRIGSEGQQGALIRALLKMKDDAFMGTSDNHTLTQKLVEYGGRENHPFIKPAVDRLLQQNFYKILTKRHTKHGEESFIMADYLNELKNAVYVETTGSVLGDRRVKRVAYQYGGATINHSLSLQKLGGLEDLTLIARDDNTQADASFTKGAGKWNFNSSFFSTVAPEDGKLAGKIKNYDGDLNPSQDFKPKVREVLQELEGLLGEIPNATYQDLLTLLDGKRIPVILNREGAFRVISASKLSSIKIVKQAMAESPENYKRITGENPIELSTESKKLVKKYNIELGMSVNAIPKVFKDQPLMRVQKVLGKEMEGLTAVNLFDLRVVLQRDFDGDHLYKYMRLPYEMIKNYNADMGDITDMHIYDGKNYQNSEGMNFNMFGVHNGKAGFDDVGMDRVASHMAKRNRIIGSVIGARGTLNYLSASGITLDGESLIRDGIQKKSSLVGESAVGIFSRAADISQNGLDKWNGIHPIERQVSDIENYFMYGEIPEGINTSGSKVLQNHDATSFFKDGFGNNSFEKKLTKIMHYTLSKVKMMQNDVYDVGGKRQPRPEELSQAAKEINSFFNDPNLFLLRKVLIDAGQLQKKGKIDNANMLRKEAFDFFFPSAKGLTANDVWKSLKENNYDLSGDIYQHMQMRFKVPSGSRKIESVVPGVVLNKSLKQPIFFDKTISAVDDLGGSVFEPLRRLNEKVEMALSFGEIDAEFIKNMTDQDLMFNPDPQKPGAKRSNEYGLIRVAANEQYAKETRIYNALRNESFVDKNKIEASSRRLNVLKSTIEALDIKYASNLIRNKDNEFSRLKVGKSGYQKMHIDGNIYKITKKKHGTISDDPKDLKYIGKIKKNKNIFLKEGTYIIDTVPVKSVSVMDNKGRWTRAFAKTMSTGELIAAHFFDPSKKPDKYSEFITDVDNLRRTLQDTYSRTRDRIKSSLVRKDDYYAQNTLETHRLFNQFFSKYIKKNGSGLEGNNFVDLMKYLLQPQIQRNTFYRENGVEIPYRRMNEKLINDFLQWINVEGENPPSKKFDFNGDKILDEMMEVMNAYHDHRQDEVSHIRTQYEDPFQLGNPKWENLPSTKDILLNSEWYADPVLMYKKTQLGTPTVKVGVKNGKMEYFIMPGKFSLYSSLYNKTGAC